jgi:hypothetical protein
VIKAIIFATYDKTGKPVDQILFELRFVQLSVPLAETGETFLLFEEQLRSMVLRLLQLDQKLTKFQTGKRSYQPNTRIDESRPHLVSPASLKPADSSTSKCSSRE